MAAGAVLTTALAGCSMIDEDLSKCGKEAVVDIELELVTNMSLELEMQLNAQTDKEIIDLLREYMSRIFTDYAHDIDLSFYDTQGDSTRLMHDQHIMDANQQRYVLHLPIHDYQHLAVANIADNNQVALADDAHCHPSRLLQQRADTIKPHATGLFTARSTMRLVEGIDQTFFVRLYMANCASTLVVDPRIYNADDIRVVASGFASQFQICDSSYVFDTKAPVIVTDKLTAKTDPRVCFCTVNFPSRESLPAARASALTRHVIETNAPFVALQGEQSLWEYRVYVRKADGTITESIVGIRQPLRPGQLKVIQVWIGDDGRVNSESPDVGISVTLDWKPGNTFTPEI